MNILVINGSPHINGNTVALVNAFKEGAESKGHTVEVIQVGTKQIKGCLGCEYCHSKGEGKCIQKDDMAQVYDALDKAEMIVFASPVYYFGFSGQMESVISRFYSIMMPKAKKYALVLSSMSLGVYDGIIAQYKGMISFFQAQDMGIIAVHDPDNKAASKLAEVKKFGETL